MRFIRELTITLTILLLSIVFLWVLVTQPTTVANNSAKNDSSNGTTFNNSFTHKQNTANIADPEMLQRHVKVLAQDLPERSDDVDKLNVSAEYIFKEMNRHTKRVQYQKFSVWGIEYQNVITEFGPQDSNDVYVIGAHYDSYNGYPGADDNASGVAGLLELAKLFAANPPPTRIQLLAYALEEPPYYRSSDMGSYQHAKHLHDDSINVRLMISMEMIGYFTDQDNSQAYPVSILKHTYPVRGNYIAVVGRLSDMSHTRFLKKVMRRATALPVYSINAPVFIPGIDFSDHLNYWLFDYPAVMITDTAFYRNKHYHTRNDTWQTLDYAKMAMVVQAVYHAVTTHMQEY